VSPTDDEQLDAGITGAQAKSAADGAFGVVVGELTADREVVIAGFGKFSVSEHAAREGSNPATEQTIQIAASTAAKFSAAPDSRSSSTHRSASSTEHRAVSVRSRAARAQDRGAEPASSVPQR
jgi:DNA-binding protein HU-beta